MYALLRAIAGVALRWYYGDIQVQGLERVPRRRPLLLVVNHPNALVDALLVGWIVPRRVLITAKSTLFQNPIFNLLLRWLGVVPLRRASDEQRGAPADRSRNTDTFQAVRQALARRGTVLIFPEGKTHDEPHLSPLKTGAARMALDACNTRAAPEIAIVPIGLTFERKDAPRTRVLVQVGEPILMDVWTAPDDNAVEALTNEIETRLRAVTMNYATSDDAARAVTLASTIAALFNPAEQMNPRGGSLSVETTIARRIDALAQSLPFADEHVRVRADELARRLDAIQRDVADRAVLLEDAGLSLRNRDGVRFVLREGWLVLIAAPIAFWGWLNHWIPFRAARTIAMRSVESAADPAMRTLVAGATLVLAAYLAQTALVVAFWGWFVGALYLVSLPVAAEINFALRARVARARQRARAYLLFRRDPALRARLGNEIARLRDDVARFDRELGDQPFDASARVAGGK